MKQREAELAEREIDLLQRELNMMIQQQTGGGGGGVAAITTPTPKKRKGHFKRSRLKLLKKDGSKDQPNANSVISAPSGRK